MIKLPDIAGINPVARILPTLAVDNIGGTAQELGDRATQFVKGREYVAQIMEKVGESAYHVRLDGDSFKGVIMKMELGTAALPGQTLLLRYMQDSPAPTFVLAPSPIVSSGATAEISSAAQLIGQYLKAAEDGGVSTRYQATEVVTQAPANPQVLSHDLKHAVSSSGLFYESHLADLLQSGQSLSSLKLEPQNQGNTSVATLVSQQLAILDNQRLSWQGEVWSGQKMDWDVKLPRQEDVGDHQTSAQVTAENPETIFSEMTLHLPMLGKVSARLQLLDGRLRINILAEQAQALDIFKSKRQSLAEALVKNGQQLDALNVMQHD